MTNYYLDTSALCKRYVKEGGSEWIRLVTTSDSGNLLLTARITMIEFYSALARRAREGSVPTDAIEVTIRAFKMHSTMSYDFIELDMSVVNMAQRLLQQYPLRAYDAVQLASCLVANTILLENGLLPLVFVSADHRLNQVAAAENLDMLNPTDV